MTTINDYGKFEGFLESVITKYNFAVDETEKAKYQAIIDEMYDAEKRRAAFASHGKQNSMGFSYIIESYRNHEQGLEVLGSKMIQEILEKNAKIEQDILLSFDSFDDFRSVAHNFISSTISAFDIDLAKYIKENALHITFLRDFVDSMEPYYEMFKGLEDFYNENKSLKKFPKSELYGYLAVFNKMEPTFIKYGLLDERIISDEEERTKALDVITKIKNKNDIQKIAEMHKMIVSGKKKAAKVLALKETKEV